MPSYLPSHYPKHIRALESIIGEIISERLDLDNVYFYDTSHAKNQEVLALISRTFDLNIAHLPLELQKEYLKAPMIAKRTLGTQEGIREALSEYENIKIQTKREDKKLKEFEFSLQVELKGDFNAQALKDITSIVNDKKPLRDNFKGLDLSTPPFGVQIPLKMGVQWSL
ncbi:hypothetical protein BKH46_07460 [Helicobacter sp. 12S02634-8]|uniref:phage tail protein n=1 Tax=Helicobacter sp. 12S02634-8 TaxID=1476199 RepID=UPI000BA5F6DD|nr:phage tail protein [Helicobacter sp. 12S02634-8]PAF46418.1 hypothetical protein BKH46_07460 [Helicobacter sp. 12S02634-8]